MRRTGRNKIDCSMSTRARIHVHKHNCDTLVPKPINMNLHTTVTDLTSLGGRGHFNEMDVVVTASTVTGGGTTACTTSVHRAALLQQRNKHIKVHEIISIQ